MYFFLSRVMYKAVLGSISQRQEQKKQGHNLAIFYTLCLLAMHEFLPKTRPLTSNKMRLEKIGCSKIFTDTISGAKTERKGLEEALAYVREGDTPGGVETGQIRQISQRPH